jgi:hypothetical protein
MSCYNGQIVYDLINKTPIVTYTSGKQTHFMWTKKAIKEYKKVRHAWCQITRNPDGTEVKGKTQYSLFNPVATPAHITEAKLLLKKGYIAPSTYLSKTERNYIESYATRERIVYEIRKSMPNKWTLGIWKYRLMRYIYAFILRKEQPRRF